MLTHVLALLRAALAKKPGPDEAPPTELAGPMPPRRIGKVGAWVGRAGFGTTAAVTATVKAATYLGLRRLDLIVNDFAAQRDPIPFATYDVGTLARMANAARAAGIEVHLMSWIMPHATFLAGATNKLRRLVEITGARSLVWDAEEPWTQARKPLPYAEAAALVAEGFAGITMGVTGIGYASAEKLGPLADVCDYLVPQCYSTQTSGLDPATVVPRLVKRWRTSFGQDKRIVAGLAAYRQPPAGYTVESGMRAAFGGAEADDAIEEVVYWSLGAIRQSAAVTRVVRALATAGHTA